MDSFFDTPLLIFTAAAAVWSLVRLMRQRRNRLVAEVQQQLDEQRRRQAREASRAKRSDAA